MEFDNGCARVTPADPLAARRAQARFDDLTKPRGSLGRLEPLVVRLAAATGLAVPSIRRPLAVVFAGDHGVSAHGVSAYGAEVTEEMAVNIALGGAVSSVLARQWGIPLKVVDVGVRRRVRHPGVIVEKLAEGTRDPLTGPAMSREEALQTVETGYRLTGAWLDEGADALLVGEMGIGNTTASAALAAALLSLPAAAVVGAGTGVAGPDLAHKRAVVTAMLERHRPRPDDPWAALAALGGFELAALAGAMVAAAQRRRPVLLDGFITGVAALFAARLCPHLPDYLFASHRSAEPGHQHVLSALGLEPLLDLDLRLGEASGALLALPLLQAATRVLAETATFADARVSNPHGTPNAPPPPREGTPPTEPDFDPAERDAVYRVIAARRDVRIFLPDPLPDEILARLLAAAHHAPSVGFMQPWSFLVVRDRQLRAAMQELAERERLRAAEHYADLRQDHYLRLKVEGLQEAPVTLIVTNDPTRGGPHVLGRNTIPETDLLSTACAIENLWLAARAEGVGVGWVSFYRREDVRSLFGIPDHVDPLAVLSLGYTPHFPDGPVLARAGWQQRLDLGDLVFSERWGRPWGHLPTALPTAGQP